MAGAAAEVLPDVLDAGPDLYQVARDHGRAMRTINASTSRARRAVGHIRARTDDSAFPEVLWWRRAKAVLQQIGTLTAELRRDPLEEVRPRVRGDCADGPRPCPWIDCRYHLFFDMAHRVIGTSKARLRFYRDDTWIAALGRMEHTCVLDMTREGPYTLEQIGQLFGLTRERVRQLEFRGKLLLPRVVTRLGLRTR